MLTLRILLLSFLVVLSCQIAYCQQSPAHVNEIQVWNGTDWVNRPASETVIHLLGPNEHAAPAWGSLTLDTVDSGYLVAPSRTFTLPAADSGNCNCIISTGEGHLTWSSSANDMQWVNQPIIEVVHDGDYCIEKNITDSVITVTNTQTQEKSVLYLNTGHLRIYIDGRVFEYLYSESKQDFDYIGEVTGVLAVSQ